MDALISAIQAPLWGSGYLLGRPTDVGTVKLFWTMELCHLHHLAAVAGGSIPIRVARILSPAYLSRSNPSPEDPNSLEIAQWPGRGYTPPGHYPPATALRLDLS
jgi:hypothetical protein